MKQNHSILLLLFVILLFTLQLHAQAPQIDWQKCFGGSDNDRAFSIEQTSDGGYIVIGGTESTDGNVTGNNGYVDAWVIKLNALGELDWQKSLGGFGEDGGFSIIQTEEGGYIFCGQTDAPFQGHQGQMDCWVVKLNEDGNTEWNKCFGGTVMDHGRSVVQTTDGGYFITGISNSNDGDVSGNHGGSDIWVVKLTVSGNIEWQKCLGGSQWEWSNFGIQTSDGGYIIAGSTESNDGDVTGNHGIYDCWIVKLNDSGLIEWSKCLGGSWVDEAYTIKQTNDNGFVMAGRTNSNDGDVSGNHSDSEDYWVVKLDESGTIQWQKCLGGTDKDIAYSIECTTDNGYIVAGYSMSIDGDLTNNQGYKDYWIVKLNSFGEISWQQNFGGTEEEISTTLKQTSDGGYIIAGFTDSDDGHVSGNHGKEDFWIIKLSTENGIEEPSQYNNSKIIIYPNPSTGIFTIESSDIGYIQVLNASGNILKQVIPLENETNIDLSNYL
ncbi:MAG: T9SS type A sorting domain-containing protein, partial [Bacteroidales bacterium]|nr:T9SS type A sorting domain-containing protein [Bacteroidales bacterium]